MQRQQIVFGAPGCGKTTYLLDILERELKLVNPDEIAFVSFTRKGTYEGKQRAKEKFGFSDDDLPYFRTLHSVAFREGKYSKYDMISKADYKEFSAAIDMKFTGYYTEEFYHNDDRYLFLEGLARNNPQAAAQHTDDIEWQKYQFVKLNYKRYKEHRKVVDFTDMLETFVMRDQPLPVKVAIIDEAQDLTTLQWSMCSIAFRDCERVYVAGDDDQAIYEWNGADVSQFLALQGERTILDKSYRLQKKILEFSKHISGMIKHRVDKLFEPINDDGDVHFYNSIDDVSITDNETWYFLARNNHFLKVYRDHLRKQPMVYVDKTTLSVKPADISAINLYEQVRKTHQMTDVQKVKLQYYVPTFDLRKPWFDAFDMQESTVNYYRDVIRAKINTHNERLMVNTIHGVKGGEADNVVLLLDVTRAVKMSFERNADAELRCLYVACTRAKKHLHIVHSSTKNGYDDYLKFGEMTG